MQEHDLNDYLKETEFCDYSHPSIRAIASAYSKKYSNKVLLAKNLFYFVRDHIHYSIGYWQNPASDTLYRRHGTCTNSTNLLIALLRASGIPAGYGILKVDATRYFGPIVPQKITRKASSRSVHIYCCVYLNGNWIKCDPSDDELLSINTQHLNPQNVVIDWDGSTDAMLKLDPSHIIHDSCPIADIDYLFKKRQRLSLWFPVRIGNLYIRFVRHHGSVIGDVKKFEVEFKSWLRRNYFFDYAGYILFMDVLSLIGSKSGNKLDNNNKVKNEMV